MCGAFGGLTYQTYYAIIVPQSIERKSAMTENLGASYIRKTKADMSPFLIHMTKNGSFNKYTPFDRAPGHYVFNESDSVRAKESLEEMIKNTVIEARSPFGHFKYQISVGYQARGKMPVDWLTCVCFSETPLGELKSFYQATQDTSQRVNKYQKYGLAFSQQLVLEKKGHPIFYFDSSAVLVVSAIDVLGSPSLRQTSKPLLPLFESFGPKLHSNIPGTTDYRWEREWRHVGHFKFKSNEVAFGLCPESEIDSFHSLSKGEITFIDPDWDAETTKEYLLTKGQTELAEMF